MIVKEIVYFDRPGAQNTIELVKPVKERAKELGIEHIVIASVSGQTTLKFWEQLQDMQLQLINVTEHVGYSGDDEMKMSESRWRELECKGIRVFRGSHILSGVERSISKRFGGISYVEIIAYVLRQFGGEGLKVAVEASVMAADAGLIPTDREVIAIGGSSRGADTAVVLKAAHMNNFFDLEIREIIAKPRQRKQGEE